MLCSICIETIEKGFFISLCGHSFHHSCIKHWNEKRNTCPMCRSGLSYTSTRKEVKDVPEWSWGDRQEMTFSMSFREIERQYLRISSGMGNIRYS